VKLTTKRLILRPIKESDWPDIVEGVGDLRIARWTMAVPHPYEKKDFLTWIRHDIAQRKKRKKDNYCLAIELKSEKKVIGVTGIFNIKEFHGSATTGSWINRKYWRQGYIFEAKIAVLDFAFNTLRLRRVEGEIFAGNKASNGMTRKLGYTLEGRRRKAEKSLATGKIHDVNVYGLLKAEWKKIRPWLIKEMRS